MIATPEIGDGANRPLPDWRFAVSDDVTLIDIAAGNYDVIRGRGARFGAKASRRAMKSMLRKPRK